MNAAVRKFIQDVGTLCEMWTVVYQSFLTQGMGDKAALTHTQAFMTAMSAATLDNKKGNDEE